MTQWLPVSTHSSIYEVSRDGLVRHVSGRMVGQFCDGRGYSLVRLSSPRVMVRVHRLVAIAFIPNHDNLPFINHIDFNKSNNVVDNLEWCTQWQNLNHSRLAGRMQTDYWKGKRSVNAKLSDDANMIRSMYASGGKSFSALGREFNISKRSVGRIISGKMYAPLPTPPTTDWPEHID